LVNSHLKVSYKNAIIYYYYILKLMNQILYRKMITGHKYFNIKLTPYHYKSFNIDIHVKIEISLKSNSGE